MTHYRIVGPLVLSFLVGNEQQDVLLDTGILERDESTIWYVNERGRHESITTANVVEAALAQGLIIEFHPIHERLNARFRTFVGKPMNDMTLVNLKAAMESELRKAALEDDIFSYGCPIDVVIFTGEPYSGQVGWYFVAKEPSNIIWFSMHKAHMDAHFPAEMFPHGRPELPTFEDR